jgi:hypothetical protein
MGPAMHMATIIKCASAAFQAAATRSWHRAERRARRRGGAPDKAVSPASRISQPAIDRGQSRLTVHAAGILRRHDVPLQRLSHHASRRATLLFPIEIADL